MADIAKVTKRELNQQTASVLARVTEGGPIEITEHGRPKWRITPIVPDDDPVERLRAAGRLRLPPAHPAPDAEIPPAHRTYTQAEIDELVQWMKGDR